MEVLTAENRILRGKRLARLRKEGKLPAVMYGKDIESKALTLSYADFLRLWREAGESTIIEVNVGEEKHNAFISEVQLDPVKNTPIHVDLKAVRMDEKVTIHVPIVFEGESPAVKQLGGVLVKVMHEVEVEAFPGDLPSEIIINISKLKEIEDRITVSDIAAGERITLHADADDIIALVGAQEEEKEEEAGKTIEDIEVAGEKEKESEEEAGGEEKKVEKEEEKKDSPKK